MTAELSNKPRAFPKGKERGIGKRTYVALHILQGMYAEGAITQAANAGVDDEISMRAAARWAITQADIFVEELAK